MGNIRLRYLVHERGLEQTIAWATNAIRTYEDICDDPRRYSSHHKKGFRNEIRRLKSFVDNTRGT